MENLSQFAPYQILGAVGILLALAEIVVPGFVVLPIGIACLLTALLALFTDSWMVLFPVLALFQFVTFFTLRKWFSKQSKEASSTNTSAMIGQECDVIETIPPVHTGYIKLYGDQWAAKSETGQEIKVGSRVIITRIDGNKVWVKPCQ